MASPDNNDAIDRILTGYESAPWLRAVIQAVPIVGGSLDTLLSWRGVALNKQRVEEMFCQVSERLTILRLESLDTEFLGSEKFFEIFRACAEAVAKTSDGEKRKLVANYLAGTIHQAIITDLTA